MRWKRLILCNLTLLLHLYLRLHKISLIKPNDTLYKIPMTVNTKLTTS